MKSEHQEHGVPIPPVAFDEFPLPDYDQWKAEAEAALKGAPFDKRMFTPTYEGIQLEPIYTADCVKDLAEHQGFPGSGPYLRDSRSGGYLSRVWHIAQGCSVMDPVQANAEILQGLKKGATAVNLELNHGVLWGSDEPCQEGRGICLADQADFDDLLRGVDLKTYPIYGACGASVAPMQGLLAGWIQRNGVDPKDLKGALGGDPLAALAQDGSLPCGLDKLYDEMASSIRWADAWAPELKTVLIRGDVYGAAGASAVQESACVLASAIAVIRAMAERGISLKVVCAHMAFSISLGANFFMEIARLRSLRSLWAHVVQAFGGDEEDQKIHLFARTSSFTTTAYDPYVNVLRAITQAFSGVLGGVEALSVGCFDEAVRPASEQARRIARNQQIMLQTEFDLLQPVDPAGGSWYVEALTHQTAAKTWEMVQSIEAAGGMAKALEAGTVQSEIAKVLQQRFKKLANRSDRAVGSNMYANTLETPLDQEPFDFEAFAASRAKALKARRSSADDDAVKAALGQIGQGCLFCALSAAFEAGATLAEVRNVLNGDSVSEFSLEPMAAHRWTEQFEALRKRTEDYRARTGSNVKVFLANMGPIPQHKGRADFSTGFMEVANFEVLKNDGFPTVEEAASAALASGADVAVICSTDATYPEIVPPLAKAIKASNGAMKVFLAGAPAAEHKESYLEAGVDEFIHVKADCLAILTEIQKNRGMF